MRKFYQEIKTKIKKEYRISLLEWKKDLKGTGVMRKIICDKINEYTELLLEEKTYIDKKYRDLTNEKDSGKKKWVRWAIDRGESRRGEYEKKIHHWETRRLINNGKMEESNLNIDGAKEYLIGEIMDVNPEMRSPGREFFKCPLHGEVKGSSFCWFKKDNKWWCFSCNIGGDSIDLYQKLFNSSFKEAVTRLNSL